MQTQDSTSESDGIALAASVRLLAESADKANAKGIIVSRAGETLVGSGAYGKVIVVLTNETAAKRGSLRERITITKKRSVSSFQAVYIPAEDLTDPAPVPTFAHLDATIVLRRPIAELVICPAVRGSESAPI